MQTILGPVEKKIVRDAMDAIQQKTCAKFRPKTDADVDYLQIDPGFGWVNYFLTNIILRCNVI